MNVFVYSGFYSLAANVTIGLFVYLKAPWKKINILFLSFSLCIAGWSVGSSLVNIITNKQIALLVLRGNYLFAVWLPVIYVHFIHVLVGKETKAIKYNYLTSIVLSIFVFTPLMIKELKVIPTTDFYISNPGPVYYLFFVFFAVSMLEVLFQTFNRLNFFATRRQFQYIAIANCLAIFAGFEYFSRVFGFFKTPPFDDYVLIVYVLIVAFAIVKYDVFNLDVIAQAFQREKLAAIGLLAASVNHEIRNPLYAAQSILQNIKEKVSRKSPEESADKALNQINRALDVITKLNRFSKPIDQNVAFNSQASVPEAIQNVLDLVSYEFSLDKIKILNRIDPNLPQIRADQRQLEEILFNLIVNACHAMTSTRKEDRQEILPVPFSDGGTLTLRSAIHDSRVTIEIIDTGSGISTEQAKHLFDLFI